MIESTVATLSGIILWYSVKYFIIGEYIYFSNKAVSVVHIWKLIPSLLCTAVSIALAGWANATDTCAASLQRISLTVVAINCTAFGVTALSVNLPTLNHWSSVAGCTCSTKCTPMCPAYNRCINGTSHGRDYGSISACLGCRSQAVPGQRMCQYFYSGCLYGWLRPTLLFVCDHDSCCSRRPCLSSMPIAKAVPQIPRPSRNMRGGGVCCGGKIRFCS